MSEQGSFGCRKWTLFGLTVFSLVLQIVLVIVSINAVDKLKNVDPTISEHKWEQAKKVVKNFLIGYSVVAILVNLFGLFGAYFENFCMTLTYAILMALATLVGLYSAIQSPIGWGNFVFYLAITVLAYLFALDIKRKRINQQIQQAQQTQPGWIA